MKLSRRIYMVVTSIDFLSGLFNHNKMVIIAGKLTIYFPTILQNQTPKKTYFINLTLRI